MDILFILALVLTSIIALTYIVERGLALRWQKVVPNDVAAAVMQYRSTKELAKLKWTCESNPSPISRLLLLGADHLEWPREENSDILETRARHEVTQLERGLVILEIIVGIAPLLGLVGTIYGLILLFGSMGGLDASETSNFARGISLALYATLLGLVIAIPTLVAWSYFSKKVETLAVEMETMCDEFLRKSYHANSSGRAQTGSGAPNQPVARPALDNPPVVAVSSPPSESGPEESGAAPSVQPKSESIARPARGSRSRGSRRSAQG